MSPAVEKLRGPIGSDRLRIAIIAPSMRVVGGQSVQADLLLGAWENDPEVEVSLIPIDPEFPALFRWTAKIPCLRTVIRAPIYWRSLHCGFRAADGAHVFSASYTSFLLSVVPALLFTALHRKNAIIHYHSGEAADHLQHSGLAIWLLSMARIRVVPSRYLSGVFARFGLDAEIVPNIIDQDQFQFRVRRPLRPCFLCPRGFHPYYRVDLVVRAFAAIQEEFPEATLLLPGTGPEVESIRSLVRQLNLKNVEFPGAVSRKEIGQYYDRADIFLNASEVDNMPVSILEAFAAGTVVVSTAPDGIRAIVDDGRTGLLSAPGDWRQLATNALRLLRDRELALRLAGNAAEQAEQYRWNSVRPQWLRLYRRLVG